MIKTKSRTGRNARRKQKRFTAPKRTQPEVFNLEIRPFEHLPRGNKPFPKSVILLRPDPIRPEVSTLFLDHIPIARDLWTYDAKTKAIRWKSIYDGGEVFLSRRGPGGVAGIGKGADRIMARAITVAEFTCSAASGAGVTRVGTGQNITGLEWDTDSPEWQNATWDEDRFKLSYGTYFEAGGTGAIMFFYFDDLARGNDISFNPWGEKGGSVELVDSGDGTNEYRLSFDASGLILDVPDNDRPGYPASIYPYMFRATEPTLPTTISGAMETEDTPGNGKLVGIQGVAANQFLNGYYRIGKNGTPFAIFEGKLQLDGRPFPSSYVKDDCLHWRWLPGEMQEDYDLPESGAMQFISNGASGKVLGSKTVARRMNAREVTRAISRQKESLPDLWERFEQIEMYDQGDGLDLTSLSHMTPYEYVINPDTQAGSYVDAIQEDVREDLTEIMNSYMDDGIWKLLSPSVDQPVLTDYLATIVAMPIDTVPDPGAWYTGLSTAVVSHGLSGGDNENCDNLNGLRAGSWINNEVSNSIVYKTHANALFQHHWQKKYNETDQYLNDQKTYKEEYKVNIDAMVAAAVADIEDNVYELPGDTSGLKVELKNQAGTAGNYAKDNGLYWAYAYYDSLTNVINLTNLAEMIYAGSDEDNAELAREIQKNLATLHALDDTEFFGQEYLLTMDTFLGSNIILQMIDLANISEEDYDMMLLYMQKFVEENLANEDQDIQDLANQIDALLAEEGFEDFLKDCLNSVGVIASGENTQWNFKYIADKWTADFHEKHKGDKWATAEKVMGGMLFTGLTGLSLFALQTAYKSWDDLEPVEQAEVVMLSLQLGLQCMASLVKLGISSVGTIFDPAFFRRAQGHGGYGRYMIMGREVISKRLGMGLFNISRCFAFMLKDTGNLMGINQKVLRKWKATAKDIQNKKVTKIVFGKNLDTFMMSRLGAVFTLAGVGFAIYHLTDPSSGIELGIEIVDMISVTLEMFAIVGGWFIEAEIIVEGFMVTVIGACGTLAVVAAIVGIGLMIYQLATPPEDPVETFVNDYAEKDGFAVEAKCSAIDYTINYDANGLMMEGTKLFYSGSTVTCGPDGLITLSAGNYLPDCVWEIETDGWGNSRIYTLALMGGETTPITVALSLMSDNTIAFAELVTEEEEEDEGTRDGELTITTQIWRSVPQGTASLSSDGENLASLALTFQAMIINEDDSTTPAGWLTGTGNGLAYSPSGPGSTFTIQQSGVAPNYMTMTDIHVIASILVKGSMSYHPDFGSFPSTPLVYAHGGDPLPDYLTFSEETGTYSFNGSVTPVAHEPLNCTVTATNGQGIGEDTAAFQIICE